MTPVKTAPAPFSRETRIPAPSFTESTGREARRWSAHLLRASKPAAAAGAFALAACTGHLSALDAAGGAAADVARLFWWMAAFAGAIWVSVMALAWYAARTAPATERAAERLIVGGGVVVPLVLLAGLLYAGLRELPRMQAPGEGLTIRVTGERWWWRVHYEPRGGPAFVTANEIRLPAGERVEFLLAASDVIHSFWIPSLGGKTDMIPGRVNRLALEASEVGEYRGACAEFCGLSHALMEFEVVVMEPASFRDWLRRQASAATPPADGSARRGYELFMRSGCGACHNISGTPANGRVGPDLTHLGGRRTIAAGTLAAEPGAIAHWIGHSTGIKAGALMPPYPMLTPDERRAIGVFLSGLR